MLIASFWSVVKHYSASQCNQDPGCCCHAARYPVHDPQPTAHRQVSYRQLHRLSNLFRESLKGNCARLQYSCICHSGQIRDVQEALQISKSVQTVFLAGGWIAATRMPESSCKIAYATGWPIRVRTRLQTGLVRTINGSLRWLLANGWYGLVTNKQGWSPDGISGGRQVRLRKSIGFIAEERY